MERLTSTPFGQRPLSAALVEYAVADHSPTPTLSTEKWPLFRALCVARTKFDLTDRDLGVLNALLTFHRPSTLSSDTQLIVFPSNKTLSARANGMAESTLRRHLAALNEAGVIRRHDSPNGKRYARKNRVGNVALAFGFDLGPLLERAKEIYESAREIEEAVASYKLLKDKVSLLKRDAVKLLGYAAETANDLKLGELQSTLLEIHKRKRRKLDAPSLIKMAKQLQSILDELRDLICSEAEKMSANDIQNERHYESSKTEDTSLEADNEVHIQQLKRATENIIPFKLVHKATPDMVIYIEGRTNNWTTFHKAASDVSAMMGITSQTWVMAQESLGKIEASVVVACMLQRITEIQRPDAYLASLTKRARSGVFSPLPMVFALLNKANTDVGVDSCQLSQSTEIKFKMRSMQ